MFNTGQTPTTAIPVGVGARAGDEGADEVTATGAQTAGPGKTPCPPDEPRHTSSTCHVSLFTFSLFLPVAEC